jgi:hypothetical protein
MDPQERLVGFFVLLNPSDYASEQPPRFVALAYRASDACIYQ